MTSTRYKNTRVLSNDDMQYRKAYASRYQTREAIDQLEINVLEYPTFEDIRSFEYANHIWGDSDKYYKLAHKYYGDSRYWWVIAWFNKKPTEAHVKVGDLVKIPLPLREVLTSYGL